MKLRKLLLGIAFIAFFMSLSDTTLAQEPQKKKEKKAKTELKEKKESSDKKAAPGEPIPGAEVTLEQEPEAEKEKEKSKPTCEIIDDGELEDDK